MRYYLLFDGIIREPILLRDVYAYLTAMEIEEGGEWYTDGADFVEGLL